MAKSSDEKKVQSAISSKRHKPSILAETPQLDLGIFETENNLKRTFREIRGYFAGNVTGITRDESIAQNIMRLLFCKIYEEMNAGKIDTIENLTKLSEENLKIEIENRFQDVKRVYPGVFEESESIELSGKDLHWILPKFSTIQLLEADRDVVGDAFEELIGTAFRGGEGQFFTPRNVVQMMIEVLDPKSGERIIDPACGSGGFLAHASRHLVKKNAQDYEVVGIDKDAFLSKVARIYLSLLDPGKNNVYCENSLGLFDEFSSDTRNNVSPESFDVILTNPPFGAKIPIAEKKLLSQFALGHRWAENDGINQPTHKLYDKQPPQILFIERCMQLLKPGGRMGIVLPEGIFGNPSDRYIWDYLVSVGRIDGVISLSQETFQPSTHTKTSVLFVTKKSNKGKLSKESELFMGIARDIGHNKNGKLVYQTDGRGKVLVDENGVPTLKDELPAIAQRIKVLRSDKKDSVKADHLGYSLPRSRIHDNIYIPEYYNPEIDAYLKDFERNGLGKPVSVGELIAQGVLSIRRGKEIGSNFYGTGQIPFVRTSDIVNWEFKVDPIKGVSEEVFDMFKKSMDIRENDILFVNDGTFLIGRTAMVTKYDLKILIQSHVRKIRVLKPEILSPYYLLYLLNTDIAQRQIASKTFVQATISTIGNRLEEVFLPVLSDKTELVRIENEVKSIIDSKAELRERTHRVMNQ